MIRRGTITKRIGGGLILLAAVMASPAFAAGLGKLTINSALGQPLSAEIELLSLQPGEFESITARVASPDAYRDARIDYGSALRLLRFVVERRSSGQPILKMTSVAPVNEPFVDVLVELNWPSGRLLREYPILLDPPGFNEARPATVPPPQAVAAAPTAAPAPASAPAQPETATVSPVAPNAPVEPAKSSVSGAAPAAVKASPSKPDTYPVVKGDTLNKIATETKAESVSLEQMLVALYRENQSAFIGNNMNRLKAGQILRVPTTDEVNKITAVEARKEIRVQVADWKAYRSSLAGSVASAPTPAISAAPANQAGGKIATAIPAPPTKAAESKDVLKLSKVDASSTKAGAAGSKGGAPTVEQMNALREEAIARESSLKEAQSRVAELEKQIKDMRKLMELKAASPPAIPVKPADPKVDEKAKPADTKLAQVEPPAKPAEPAKVEATKPGEAGKPGDATKVAEAPKPAVAPPPMEPPKPAAKPKAAAPPPPAEPSIGDMVMDNLPFIAGGAGALILLGFIGWTFSKRRKSRNSAGPFTSAASSILPSDLKPPTTSAKAAGGLIDTGNSSFLTDFDKAGPGTIDTDEVDPVAEAEVYIAYGRDAQAEEILKEAMARDKSRHEIALKLLEIYHTRKSASAFETLAREFKETVGAGSPEWARAAAMGVQLEPDNKLYAGFGQDFGATASMAAAASEADKGAPPNLDFDIGANSSTQGSLDQPVDLNSAKSGADFDLNLGPASADTAPAVDEGDAGLDFDLGFEKPSAAPAKPAAAAPKDESGGFDFDLSSLSLDSLDDKSKAPPTPSADEQTQGFKLGDISLDLDAVPTAEAGGGGGADSAATKLELARAYVEIGDKDGAKEILEEVAREGSAAQKQEAKSLLESF